MVYIILGLVILLAIIISIIKPKKKYYRHEVNPNSQMKQSQMYNDIKSKHSS